MNMPRGVTYVGIISALVAGVLVMILSISLPSAAVPQVASPLVAASATTTTSASSSLPVSSEVKKVLTKKIASPVNGRNVALDAAVSRLLSSLVNIICYAPSTSGLHSMSASGVFIDSKGIILTNAHVAQYFLLEDKGVKCVIRSGRPATDQYRAKLVYISPRWLYANPDVLTATNPVGTGQYDMALLGVTESATEAPLPQQFPFEPLAKIVPAKGTPVVIASYAAQFLQSSQIISTLYPTVVSGSLKEVYTFATDTIDVLSVGGSAAAQEGSSGGGVVDASGKLIALVTTSSADAASSLRSLDAITAKYIREEFARETKGSLDLLLEEGVETAVTNFASAIPALEPIITRHLP